MYLSDILVIVRGGGELGTGVAHRLYRSGFTVMVTELAQPRTSWPAAFARAIVHGSAAVEEALARRADDPMAGMAFSVLDEIPVVVDETGDVVARMQPRIVVDARQAGRNLGTRRYDAPLVIGLGSGFAAGQDCHAVVETQPGPTLGRVYWEASAQAPAAPPPEQSLGPIDAFSRSSVASPSLADAAAMVTDRARSVGGGVLEAILAAMDLWRLEPPPERDPF